MIEIELYKLKSGFFTRVVTITDVLSLNWSNVLNGVGSASFSISIWDNSATKNYLRRYETQVAIKVDGIVQWFGTIINVTAGIKDISGSVNVQCATYLYHLKARFTDQLMVFSDIDQSQILGSLIDFTQTRSIDGVTDGANLGIIPDLMANTKNRDRTYEYKSIGDAIIEMSGVIGGVDFDFIPQVQDGLVTGVYFRTYFPKGSNRTDLQKLELNKNVLSFNLSTTGEIYTSALALGNGTGTDMMKSSKTSQPHSYLFTRREAILPEKDILTQGTLDLKTSDFLNEHQSEQYQADVVLNPDSYPNFSQIQTGDILNIAIDAVSNQLVSFQNDLNSVIPDILNYSGQAKILGISCSIDGQGTITTTPRIKLI